MIIKAYRKYIPPKIRDYIYSLILRDILFFIRNFKTIIKAKFFYWFNFLVRKNPANRAFIFMGKYGICLLPYAFTLKYKQLKITLYRDESNQLMYIMHNDKKLYFPRNFTNRDIETLYKQLLAEEDDNSPHRYIKSWDELSGKILLDIGAAEGLISLNAIDYTEHIFLFESDENWIEALRATFEPYKNKVTIIKRYISNINDENHLTIDHFLEGKMINNLFIKMDIEGAELLALQGAENVLSNAKDVKLAICTYHRKDDFRNITDLFSTKGLIYNK